MLARATNNDILSNRSQLLVYSLASQIAFCIERRHASGSSRRDGLSIVVVGDIPGCKDSLGAGDGPIGLCPSDVSIGMRLDLAREKLGIGSMADGEEHPCGIEIGFGSGLNMLDTDAGDPDAKVRVVPQHFIHDGVFDQLDFWVIERALLHDLGSSHFTSAQYEKDLRRVLGQIACLLDCRVTTPDDDQWTIAKTWERSIANSASADPFVAKLFFARKSEIVRAGTGGDDDRMRFKSSVICGMQSVRGPRKIDAGDIVGNHARPKVDRLLPHQFHQLRTGDSMGMLLDRRQCILSARLVEGGFQEDLELAGWKARIIFDFGGLRQLPHGKTSHDSIFFGHGPFEQKRLEICTRRIDGSRPARRPTADDDTIFDVAHEFPGRDGVHCPVDLDYVVTYPSHCDQNRQSGSFSILRPGLALDFLYRTLCIMPDQPIAESGSFASSAMGKSDATQASSLAIRGSDGGWRFTLSRDTWGHLQLLDADGKVYPDVSVIPLFPISASKQWISIVSCEGQELACLDDLSGITQENRRRIDEELAFREFVPIIQRVVRVSGNTEPCEWVVETNHGLTSFVLKAEEDVRRVSAWAVNIMDANGIRFRVEDLNQLDSRSRAFIEWYV